jgi:hypothetical protein
MNINEKERINPIQFPNIDSYNSIAEQFTFKNHKPNPMILFIKIKI